MTERDCSLAGGRLGPAKHGQNCHNNRSEENI